MKRPKVSDLPRFGKLVVPWVAKRSEEPYRLPGGASVQFVPFEHGGKQTYRLEIEGLFRDDEGFLWAPDEHPDAPGPGRPLFAQVATARGRRCMDELLCQVCAGSAVHAGRSWWLVQEDAVVAAALRNKDVLLKRGLPALGEVCPIINAHAPVCRRCQALARQMCPAFKRARWVSVSAARVVPAGVMGDVYDTTGNLQPGVYVAPSSEDAPMILAKQRVVGLIDWRREQ